MAWKNQCCNGKSTFVLNRNACEKEEEERLFELCIWMIHCFLQWFRAVLSIGSLSFRHLFSFFFLFFTWNYTVNFNTKKILDIHAQIKKIKNKNKNKEKTGQMWKSQTLPRFRTRVHTSHNYFVCYFLLVVQIF